MFLTKNVSNIYLKEEIKFWINQNLTKILVGKILKNFLKASRIKLIQISKNFGYYNIVF